MTPFLFSPQFLDPYFSLKEISALIAFGGALIAILWSPLLGFKFPRFDRVTLALILAIFVILLLDFLFLPSKVSSLILIILFFISTILSIQLFSKQNTNQVSKGVSASISLALIAPLTLSTFQLFFAIFAGRAYSQPLSNLGYFSGQFGNANIFAQFCLLGAISSLYAAKHFNDKKFPSLSLVFPVIFIWSSSLIALSSCRSSILALTASFLFLSMSWKTPKQWVLTFLLYIFVLYKFAAPMAAPNAEQIQTGKSASVSARFALWEASFNMIKDRPEGIGFGQFSFNTFPFRNTGDVFFKPNYNDKSPHNEFIRIALEGGIPLLVVGFALVTFLFKKWIGQIIKTGKEDPDLLAFALLGALFIESMLHFPFEMTHPVVILGFVSGYIVYRSNEVTDMPLPLPVKGIATLAIMIIITYKSLASHNIEKVDYYLGDFTTWGCENRLFDWRRCLQFSKSIEKAYPEPSESILERQLYFQPYNIHIVQEKVRRQFNRPETREVSCIGYNYHRSIYRGEDYFPLILKDKCHGNNVPSGKQALRLHAQWVNQSNIKTHWSYHRILKNNL